MTAEEISSIEEKTQLIAQLSVERQYALQPDIWERYGEKGRELSIRDIGQHLVYLTQAIKADDSAIFVNYVLWLKELFAGLGFPDSVLPVMLQCMQEVFKESLPEEVSGTANKYLRAASDKLNLSSAKEESFIPDDAPHAELARTYLNLLLQSHRNDAAKLIMDAVENGISIQDIYMHVFQASQYEIGRLWHTKQVSVAQEHFCSAATERIMSQLYGRIFTTKRIKQTYVSACVGGELHQMGARMVADFFEMEGYDTYYMGANTPTPSILDAIAEYRADILGISCTMSFHRSTLEELIKSVRAFSDMPPNLKIVVGGYSFIKKPDLWKEVGADSMAKNAQEAIKWANRLVKA
jgi:methanogenic corrinoid protein MtbC1